MATEWMESGYSIRKRKEKVDPRLSNRVIEWVVGSIFEIYYAVVSQNIIWAFSVLIYLLVFGNAEPISKLDDS